MAEYFQNPDDLKAWVRSKGSHGEAAKLLLQMMDTEDELSEVPRDEQEVCETCQQIFETDDNANASEILFGVLAKHNITKLNKTASMQKTAASRQRNDWSRGARNKWNRCVDGYNADTPWRVGRDEYYDFTHYATDEIKFDEDPQHVYSGESLWRTYIMDKFYRDYKDKKGHVVGGYINDRFYVFPTAGTPANPNVPRTQGNQMELADGERTRQPKPHEWNYERRLEEARGNKTQSITVAAQSFEKVVKVASKNHQEAQNDKVFNIFKDTVEMREAGIPYELMIESIADQYNASILGVSQIDRVAQKLVNKHNGIGYQANIKKSETLAEILQSGDNGSLNIQITQNGGASAILSGDANQSIQLDPGTVVVNVPNSPNVFEITDSPTNSALIGSRISFTQMDFEVNPTPYIQEAADELGLNEDEMAKVQEAVQMQGDVDTANQTGYATDFSVTEIPS